MAAQPEEITESNEDIRPVIKEMAEILREVRELLVEVRPLLDKYVSNPAAKWRRRAVPQDRQG